MYALGAIPVSLPPLFKKLNLEVLIDVGGVAISAALIIWGISLLRNPVDSEYDIYV